MSEGEPPPSQKANLLALGTRTRVTQSPPKGGDWQCIWPCQDFGVGDPSGAELCSANASKCLGGGSHSVIH